MTTYRMEYDGSAGPEDAEAGRVWDVLRSTTDDGFKPGVKCIASRSTEEDAKLIVAALCTMDALVDNFEEIELWYVKGIGGTYYVNKEQAERACRAVMHDETPEQQYARIFFRRFYREVA